MLRKSLVILARRKHGQKAWSSNATSSGAAPANGVTAQEALQIAYRPMPPAQTVEYEEDFGPNMMIHREFVSKKSRNQMSFDVSALAYSDVELRRGQQQLASVMNRERRGVLVGDAGLEGDRVHFNVDVDDTTREVRSARYLFNEQRLQFCERFQNFFRARMDPTGKAEDDSHFLFSLMEACAIIYGCETTAAQETYFCRFLGLDLDSLEAAEEALRERLVDAAEVSDVLTSSSSSSNEEEEEEERDALMHQRVDQGRVASGSCLGIIQEQAVQAMIDAVPPLFGDDRATGQKDYSSSTFGVEATSSAEAKPTTKDEGPALPDQFEEYAPLYKAYLAHAAGQSPVASYDISTLGSSTAIAEHRRWRGLMDKIVSEEYHNLTDTELRDAVVLNNQLHTIKFFDLKIGDTVREVMQLLQRETGDGSSAHRDTPLEASAAHPERRV